MNSNSLPDIKPENLHQEPIERAETIPSGWYHSEKILEFEKEALFSSYWQYACHENELSEPGDMNMLEVAENPLLLVRDREDQINAFYNVCRHRGGPVAVKKERLPSCSASITDGPICWMAPSEGSHNSGK